MESVVISNPGEGQWLKHIDWNREEIEAQIREAVKDYQNVAYGEDQIRQAKADRATLNKLRKEIDDRRKAVKKAINAPYDIFEKEVKEVLAIVDDASGKIDSQVKAYEEKQREEKRNAYMEYFHSALGDLAEKFDPEKLVNRSWDNSTVSTKKIHEEIDAKVKMIRSDLEYISGLEDDEQAVAEAEYQRAYDLGSALAAVNRFKSAKKENEERKNREAGAEAAQRLINRLESGERDKLSCEAENDENEVIEEETEAEIAEPKAEEPEDLTEGDEKPAVRKVSVPFNGDTAQNILDIIHSSGALCRGEMKIEILSTEADYHSVVDKIRSCGIRVTV